MENSHYTQLRNLAEDCLAKQADPHRCELDNACKLMHELDLYVIELGLQNDQLLQAKMQLSKSVERYRQVYDSSPVGYFVLKPTGDIQDINLTGANMLEVERSLLSDRSLADFLSPTPLFQGHLDAAKISNGNVTIELQLLTASNELKDVQLESRLVENFPEQTGIIHTVMTDISFRKNLEREIQQQRLELNTLLQQQIAVHTAAAIAHDLNQPLTAISLFSELALKSINSSAEIDTKAAVIRDILLDTAGQAQKAGQRLHELMEFLQQGEVITEPLDLNRLIQKALNIVQDEGLTEFRHILELEDKLRPVLANSIQVEKVLVNLIRNGVQAMLNASDLSGNITTIVRSLSEWNMAQVTVQDTGPGINADMLKRIFDPFFSTKPTGIGMGLAISRALIEANGGQLWLEPSSGTGAIFHFTLPFVPL